MKKYPPTLPIFFNEKGKRKLAILHYRVCFTYLFEIFLSKFSSARTEIA